MAVSTTGETLVGELAAPSYPFKAGDLARSIGILSPVERAFSFAGQLGQLVGSAGSAQYPHMRIGRSRAGLTYVNFENCQSATRYLPAVHCRSAVRRVLPTQAERFHLIAS